MSLRTLTSPGELRAAADAARARGERVGLVPTMGALHDGHLALVREARRRADEVIVSIFVNPTQFGAGEDFARYPRDLARDLAALDATGASVVFAPERAAMYPPGDETRVRLGRLTEELEGAFRPTHFEGVATVVTKLFGLVGPAVAVFGRKDYQQLVVVRRLVVDLFLPIEIVGHPIVREPDGLAMSSRNAYLSADERRRALAIVEGLRAATVKFAAGERRARELEATAGASIHRAATSIDYVEARNADDLEPLGEDVGERALLAVACHVGKTRLIDNVVLGEDALASLEPGARRP